MAEAYVFLADGFETVECLAVVDVLRRGHIDTETVSVTGKKNVKSSHGIEILADRLWDEIQAEEATLLFLPGGKQGTQGLGACKPLVEALKKAAENPDKRVAAICAAPSVLGQAGILVGKDATCYPGWEDKLIEANYTRAAVVTDGNVTTGRGMGVSVDMGLELLKLLRGEEEALRVKKEIQHPETI